MEENWSGLLLLPQLISLVAQWGSKQAAGLCSLQTPQDTRRLEIWPVWYWFGHGPGVRVVMQRSLVQSLQGVPRFSPIGWSSRQPCECVIMNFSRYHREVPVVHRRRRWILLLLQLVPAVFIRCFNLISLARLWISLTVQCLDLVQPSLCGCDQEDLLVTWMLPTTCL